MYATTETVLPLFDTAPAQSEPLSGPPACTIDLCVHVDILRHIGGYRGGHGPLEAHVPNLALQKSVESVEHNSKILCADVQKASASRGLCPQTPYRSWPLNHTGGLPIPQLP